MCLSGLPIPLISKLSTGVRYTNLPENYVRPESDRPRLSEYSARADVPVIDLGLEDRTLVFKLIAEACKSYGFFRIEFFSLPVEKKLKLYSDDPSKTLRLSTIGDYLRIHCYPTDKYVPDWPSNFPDFK
uniref:Uncharacterized protein n=1 Tax=Quercus lobata TaxID=97700 RepID=A0A7N2RAB7_QUELO